MKFSEQELCTLWSILRPYVPSEDWTADERDDFEKLLKRVQKHLQKKGYEVNEVIE